jgi:hypothetical protein
MVEHARLWTPVPPLNLHGKEGVDGSSPSEGLQNPRSRGFSVQDDLLFVARAVGMEPFMELSRRERLRFVVCEDNSAFPKEPSSSAGARSAVRCASSSSTSAIARLSCRIVATSSRAIRTDHLPRRLLLDNR